MKIGEIMPLHREIELNQGRETKSIVVSNVGDRPIQVGSHFHFFEVNRLLVFDRAAAYGFRLNIPSGTSVRFEPGEEKTVELVALGGNHRVFGLNDLTCGQADAATAAVALDRAEKRGFVTKERML